MSSEGVGVKATFSMNGQVVHELEPSERQKSPSQPVGVGQQGAVEGTDKYDHRYTGIHDHGLLPALRTGGPHGKLVNALLEAKKDSDAFLTELINRELAQKSGEGKERASSKAESRGGLGGAGAAQPEAMEVCRAEGGTSSGVEGGDASPPTMQPTKRPKP